MNRILKFFAFFYLFVLMYSCKTTKELKPELKDTFLVEEAFIQEELPGLQGEEIKQYLTLKIGEVSYANNSISSISVKGKYAVFTKEDKTDFSRNPIKLRLKKNPNTESKQSLEVWVYYMYEGKIHYQIIKDILIKESIYLP